MQVFAHALDFDVLGRSVLFAVDLLQLVLHARLRFDAQGLTTLARALRHVQELVVFGFACVDNDFVLLGCIFIDGHDVLSSLDCFDLWVCISAQRP